MNLEKKVLSGKTYLSYELSDFDIIDTTSLGMLSNNTIEGILSVQQFRDDEKISLNYDISSKISLDEYLHNYINNDNRIQILINITNAVLLAGDYIIEYTQLMKDLRYIFIDENTLDIYLMYLPLENYEHREKFNNFIQNLLYRMKYEANADTSHMIDIHNYLSMEPEEYLSDTYLEDFKKLLQNLKRRERKYVGTRSVRNEYVNAVTTNNTFVPVNTVNTVHSVEQSRPLSIKEAEKVPEKPVQKKMSQQSFQIPGNEKPVVMASSKKADKKTDKKGIFPFFGKKKEDKKEDKNIAKKEDKNQNIAPELSVAYAVPDNISETTVLSQSGFDETTVLGMPGISRNIARIKRKLNGEVININKTGFMLGKDRYSVDYCIADNSSVSRNHAEIICENGKYFIVDNNSLNGTYLNGNRLSTKMAQELKSGDVIILANEVFEFIISDM